MKLEYNSAKARTNFKKHGVSFEEAATSFYDPMALSRDDPDAEGEGRWILVGQISQARLLTVIYTLRKEQIRLISARKSTRSEANHYA